MDVSTTLNLSGRAVAFGLDYLRHGGIEWSPHPTEEEVRGEYERIWSLLGNRTIEDVIDLPLMDDPASLATVDVLIKVLPPAKQTDENLASLAICKAVSLSIEHGNCDVSCVAYEYRQDCRTAFRRSARLDFDLDTSALSSSNDAG